MRVAEDRRPRAGEPRQGASEMNGSDFPPPVRRRDECTVTEVQPLVIAEVTAGEDKARAELARPPPRHAAPHTEGARLVRGREHHAATHRHRIAAQLRLQQLLDRGVERVQAWRMAALGEMFLFSSE